MLHNPIKKLVAQLLVALERTTGASAVETTTRDAIGATLRYRRVTDVKYSLFEWPELQH